VGKKFVAEIAKVECCESRFDVKKLTQTWKIKIERVRLDWN
jgi:hypothetical protein